MNKLYSFCFGGRMSLCQYRMHMLCNTCICLVFLPWVQDTFCQVEQPDFDVGMLDFLLLVVFCMLSGTWYIACIIRRRHDLGLPGAIFINLKSAFDVAFTKGHDAPNQYGPVPDK